MSEHRNGYFAEGVVGEQVLFGNSHFEILTEKNLGMLLCIRLNERNVRLYMPPARKPS